MKSGLMFGNEVVGFFVYFNIKDRRKILKSN